MSQPDLFDRCLVGDVRAVLPTLPAGIVQCAVTSPPFWGLRDYGHADQIGMEKAPDCLGWATGEPCGSCYVCTMVGVCREVRRVLRPDGVLFLELGDSYSANGYGRIRGHEADTFFALPVDIRRQVFLLWRRALGVSVQGDVRDLLSAFLEEGAPDQHERVREELLQTEQGRLQQKNNRTEQEAQGGDDSGLGREVCVLRGDAPDLSVPGPHQGRRKKRIPEGGGVRRGVEAGDSGRLGPTEIPDSLLELQRRAWALWKVPSLQLDLADVPRDARGLFAVTLKPKDICGIPWRVALALQADGWWLRSDIVWARPNPMPESVTDRPTKAHSYLFLLTKRATYYYDAEALREPHKAASLARYEYGLHLTPDPTAIPNSLHDRVHAGVGQSDRMGDFMNPAGRNARSVWNIATTPFRGAHFACWPPELVKRCILAGTSEAGCCEACGTPRERIVERTGGTWAERKAAGYPDEIKGDEAALAAQAAVHLGASTRTTTGWRPTCACDAPFVPCLVLDPFMGSGTTAKVAQDLGRRWLGVELNEAYVGLQTERAAQTGLPLLAGSADAGDGGAP